MKTVYNYVSPTVVVHKVVLDLEQTFGREPLNEPVNVTIDSTVVLPSDTRAGTESLGIQKDSQERTTSIMVGMYI